VFKLNIFLYPYRYSIIATELEGVSTLVQTTGQGSKRKNLFFPTQKVFNTPRGVSIGSLRKFYLWEPSKNWI